MTNLLSSEGLSPLRTRLPLIGPARKDSPVQVSERIAGGDIYLPTIPVSGRRQRVLVVGDSHTVGPFGGELDRRLRAAGAEVSTYGSCGASPGSWLSGTPTRCGFVARHRDGTTERPRWRVRRPDGTYQVIPHATPRLQELLKQEHPDAVIVALGANLNSGGVDTRVTAARLAGTITATGAHLVWVGPPSGDPKVVRPEVTERVSAALRDTVSGLGVYIDSRPFTTQYRGSDGRHFATAEGKAWAEGVANVVTGMIAGTP